MDIYFVRHGQYNPLEFGGDGSLTLQGNLQSKVLGERFLGERVIIEDVYYSTELRAKETAQGFCNNIGYPFWRAIGSDYLVEERDWEDEEDVVHRMQKIVNDIVETPNVFSDSVFVFGHSGSLKSLIQSYSDKKTALTVLRLPHCGFYLVKHSPPNGFCVDLESDSNSHLKGIESC